MEKYCYTIVLSYRIDLYFTKYRLAIEVDEKGHKNRNEYKEVEREKATKERLDCKFIRINPDEIDFDMYVEISKIYNHISKPSKKSVIDKISKRLSELEFINQNQLLENLNDTKSILLLKTIFGELILLLCN